MDPKEITKLYILYTGNPHFKRNSFYEFKNDFNYLFENLSSFELEKIIKSNLKIARDELEPKVNSNELKELILTPDTETEIFLSSIDNKYITDAVNSFLSFPFKKASNKIRIKNALLSVYGEDLKNLGNENLGKIPEIPESEENPTKDVSDPQKSDLDKAEDKNKTEPLKEESSDTTKVLDPKLEEDAVLTLEKYLQQYIFNSKLIPQVKIINAFEVKNGYIIEIEFSSIDGKTKAFAKAVIHNNKLIPPAELEDENGNKLGDFTHETFTSLFSIEPKQSKSSSYISLLDEMLEAPTYVQAGKVLRRIAELYGPDVANNALDTFIKVKTKRDTRLPNISKLNVKVVDSK